MCRACSFQRLAVDIPEKEWNFPKFWDMHKFEHFVLEFGCARAADTAHDERSHKDLKALKNFTNNHQDFLNQVSATLCPLSICQDALQGCWFCGLCAYASLPALETH